MTEKLDTIEMALAHQEQQITDLNEMMNRQWKEIEQLQAQLKKMQDKLNAAGSSDDRDPHSGLSVSEIAAMEKPPHY
jgi:SlyX protein